MMGVAEAVGAASGKAKNGTKKAIAIFCTWFLMRSNYQPFPPKDPTNCRKRPICRNYAEALTPI
jgi:hypothetical protein